MSWIEKTDAAMLTDNQKITDSIKNKPSPRNDPRGYFTSESVLEQLKNIDISQEGEYEYYAADATVHQGIETDVKFFIIGIA